MRDHSGCLWEAAPHSDSSYDCGHLALYDGASLEARMHEAPDGNMVLSAGSLLVVRPGRFQIATRANGLPALADALPAQDGTIWLAGYDGLYRFASPFRMESWTIREGVSDPPWSVARVGGNIYAGLEQRIVALDKDRFRWSPVTTFSSGGSVSGLLGTGDGRLFASFIDGGAVQLQPDGQVVARTEIGHPKSGMRWASTADGEIWLGGNTLARLTRTGPALWLEEHPLRSTPAGNVLSVKYEAATRNLWACYNGGLVRRDEHGAWREFDTSDGLKTNGCWSMTPLANGDLWYGYFNLRAFAFIHPGSDGGIKVRQYDSKNLAGAAATTLDVDHQQRVWRSGEAGIFVADADQALAGTWLQLDQSDGLPAQDMNTGSVFVDRDGSLGWGADNDLAHYSPSADLVSPQFAPRVFVSAISWEGRRPG